MGVENRKPLDEEEINDKLAVDHIGKSRMKERNKTMNKIRSPNTQYNIHERKENQ